MNMDFQKPQTFPISMRGLRIEGKIDNAIKYFEKASSNNPNEYFTPSYLLKLALVYEQVDDLESALDCYITIINEFKESSEFQISIKNRKRIEGLML